MSIIERIKQNARTASVTAGNIGALAAEKSKFAIAVAKLKTAIASEEKQLNQVYTEIGRIYYRDYEAKAEPDLLEYTPLCEKASEARANILRLTAELDDLKNRKVETTETAEKTSADAPTSESVPVADEIDFAD